MTAARTIEITGEVRNQTNLAWLIFDGSVEVWLPKKLVTVRSTKDGLVLVAMPDHLAKRKGLLGARKAAPTLSDEQGTQGKGAD